MLTYFQGRQCICYPNLLATTATQVIDRHCNTLCPGDDNYICGSLNATVTTVYRANGKPTESMI